LKLDGNIQSDDYRTETLYETVGLMEVSPGEIGTATVNQSAVGFKFVKTDEKQVIMSRVNGMSFSRLSPYECMESFRGEAQRFWRIYRECISEPRINRIAVRYANRIDVPGNSVDLKNYFRTTPEIAPELPQQIDGFFMQLRLPFPDIGATAIINQTIIPPRKAWIRLRCSGSRLVSRNGLASRRS
jgi:uncharacterized protein (TIGR04255 family)